MISTFGDKSPCLVFIGHTDVVPPGDLDKWKSNPYLLHEENGILTGRGTADMKGGIACFMSALSEFLKENGSIDGSIKLVLTGDERRCNQWNQKAYR